MKFIITSFLSRRKALLKEIQSLLGLFLSIDSGYSTISKQIKEDLKIWDIFLSSFNGFTIWQELID